MSTNINMEMNMNIENKNEEEYIQELLKKAESFFRKFEKVAIGFSGGVDSSLVLKLSKLYCTESKGYYVKSQFQPQFELDDAKKLSSDINACVEYINMDILKVEEVRSNPSNRCYYCKRNIFSTIIDRAKKDGFSIIFDGTNFSDDEGDRPGMVALKELKVISPLRELKFTKEDVRLLSKSLNLFTHSKDSYSCLATRISSNEVITMDKLQRVEEAEKLLFRLGFKDFRVRTKGNFAKLEIKDFDFDRLVKNRKNIVEELGKDFEEVVLNLKER